MESSRNLLFFLIFSKYFYRVALSFIGGSVGSFLESIRKGDIAQRCLVVGSARQAQAIRKEMCDVRVLREDRFPWFTGSIRQATGTDTLVSVVSMGDDERAFLQVLDAASRGGGKVFVMIDRCVSLHEGSRVGGITIIDCALRRESLLCRVLPQAFPAVCDRRVVAGLEAAALAVGAPFEVGIELTWSGFGWPNPSGKVSGEFDDLWDDEAMHIARCLGRAGSLGCLWALKHGRYPFGVVNANVGNRATGVIKRGAGDALACKVALNAIVRLQPNEIVPPALLP